MKKLVLFTIFYCCSISILFSQVNYRIVYDKLSDEVSFYKQIWLNGDLEEESVKSIHLKQNDIVVYEVVNVNPFIFSTEIYMSKTELTDQNASPIATILSGFSGFGGPALGLLTSMASRPPEPVFSSRGDVDLQQEQRLMFGTSVNNVYSEMTEILDSYRTYDQMVQVKYSKSLTQEQILANLDSLNELAEFSQIQSKYDHMISELDKLALLRDSLTFQEDDVLLADYEFIIEKVESFQEAYIDEDGNILTVDLSNDIFDVQIEDFSLSHTFKAITESRYEKYSSNDFFVIFSEIKGDDPEFYPVDFIKKISIPVAQPKAPYWVLTVQNFNPIGGMNTYNIQVVYEDWFSGDSLLVNQTKQSGGMLTFGTMLSYDFLSEKPIMPSMLFGAGISGVNKNKDQWALSLALGAGLSFQKFPFLSLNGGIGLTQGKVLKDEFYLNRAFAAPEGANEYNGYADLFTTKFRPSVFFGVGIRL